MSTNVAAEIVARCFAARTSAHFAHLSTKSYAAHMALGDFYDDVAEKADVFCECWQSWYGLMGEFPSVPLLKGETQPIAALREFVASNRTQASQGKTELGNLLDEILSVCDRALYKLKNLA